MARERSSATRLSAERMVASVSKGSVPFGDSRSWNPWESSKLRNDSRMPLESMTMSSSIAAETATPRMASAVRARWRMSDESARVAIIAQRPNRVSGAVCASRRAASQPETTPSTSDSATARSTMSPVTMEKRSGVRYTA